MLDYNSLCFVQSVTEKKLDFFFRVNLVVCTNSGNAFSIQVVVSVVGSGESDVER